MRRSLPVLFVATLVAMSCTGRSTDAGSSVSPNISATPTVPSSPAVRVDADRYATRTPIKHVVFLIKENRTFDNLFGTFPGANGATAGMDQGAMRPLHRGTDQGLPGDIPHCYWCSIAAWDGGKMDGFDQGPQGAWAYSQLHRDQLPNYWHWATNNVLFDNFFASAWGPSFPNHLYSDRKSVV